MNFEKPSFLTAWLDFYQGIADELFARFSSLAELERMAEFCSNTSPAFTGHYHIIRMHRFLSSFVFVFVLVCHVAVLSSCKKDSNNPSNTNPDFATLNTTNVSSITSITASSGGNITSDGNRTITARGVVWSTSQNPIIALTTKTVDGTGMGSFTSSITGLSPNTTYFVRSYATNSAGTAYGNEITFNTLTQSESVFNPDLTYGTVSDIDGNTYKTIVIGTQTWMAENLKTTKYRNGTEIESGLTSQSWGETSKGAYAICENNQVNNNRYGKLYNYYAVVNPLGLCPVGWRPPSDDDWKTLESYMGMNINELDEWGNRGSSQNVGGKLTSKSSLWSAANSTATNESGFSALPGGSRTYYGEDGGINTQGKWWASSTNTFNPWSRSLGSTSTVGRFNWSNDIRNQGLSVRCLLDNMPSLPILNTTAISSINTISAKSGGTISNYSSGNIIERGVAWSTNPNPTVTLSTKTSDGSGTGSFTSSLIGLSPNTTYFVRAYATTSAGTAYGNQQTMTTTIASSVFNPNLTYGTMSDIDGNTYKTIQIGTQIWMAENLKTTKYRNGDPIQTNLTDAAWGASTSGAYSIYNNDAANNTTYGKLYNWYAVTDSRSLCPLGSHLPSDEEWTSLENFLGGTGVAGGMLKSTSSLWLPNTSSANTSGFSGLPGGGRYESGTYFGIRNDGCWWSTSESSASDAWLRYLNASFGSSVRGFNDKHVGFSVRCIKD